MSALRTEKMAEAINSVVVQYMSWIAQLVRALAQKVLVWDRTFLFKF